MSRKSYGGFIVMKKQETTVNIQLLAWCVVVIIELVVITMLTGWPFVLLIGLVLYRPVKDALAWPVVKETPPPVPQPVKEVK